MKLPLNIAIVDDEEEVHTIFNFHFKKAIKKNDLVLHNFLNGKDCYDFIADKTKGIEFILIYSDINMPVMNGLKLLESIKENFPEIDVVMVSAYKDSEQSHKAQELGADNFLEKPVDFAKLKEDLYRRYGVSC